MQKECAQFPTSAGISPEVEEALATDPSRKSRNRGPARRPKSPHRERHNTKPGFVVPNFKLKRRCEERTQYLGRDSEMQQYHLLPIREQCGLTRVPKQSRFGE